MTICMNMSRFINLAAIFSLDLESQCNSVNKLRLDDTLVLSLKEVGLVCPS